MDPEVLHLFNNTKVISVDDLRHELQHLGITHIHKDNYFSWPMIYRTPFQELLADSRFAIPVVMGNGGNIYQLRKQVGQLEELPSCIQRELQTAVIPDGNGMSVRALFPQLLSNLLNNANGIRAARTVSSGERIITEIFSPTIDAASGVSLPRLLKSPTNRYLRVSLELRGFGIALGSIRSWEGGVTAYSLPPWTVFSESRDKRGVIRLIGQVPVANESLVQLSISTSTKQSDALFEILSITTCMQSVQAFD